MPVVEMGWVLGAKSVTASRAGNIIEETANPSRDTIHTRSPIGLLVELRKSDAERAESGRLRLTSIKTTDTRTD